MPDEFSLLLRAKKRICGVFRPREDLLGSNDIRGNILHHGGTIHESKVLMRGWAMQSFVEVGFILSAQSKNISEMSGRQQAVNTNSWSGP